MDNQGDEPVPRDGALDDEELEGRRDREARWGFLALVVVGTAALLVLFLIFGGPSRAAVPVGSPSATGSAPTAPDA